MATRGISDDFDVQISNIQVIFNIQFLNWLWYYVHYEGYFRFYQYSNTQYSRYFPYFNFHVELVGNTVNYDYGYDENKYFSSNLYWILFFSYSCRMTLGTVLQANNHFSVKHTVHPNSHLLNQLLTQIV